MLPAPAITETARETPEEKEERGNSLEEAGQQAAVTAACSRERTQKLDSAPQEVLSIRDPLVHSKENRNCPHSTICPSKRGGHKKSFCCMIKIAAWQGKRP